MEDPLEPPMEAAVEGHKRDHIHRRQVTRRLPSTPEGLGRMVVPLDRDRDHMAVVAAAATVVVTDDEIGGLQLRHALGVPPATAGCASARAFAAVRDDLVASFEK